MTTIDYDVRTEAFSGRAVRRLEDRLLGEVLQPEDAEYDRARRVWNPAIDRFPALIVRPRGAPDIMQAVDFARAFDLPLAVRSGGHNVSGHGVVDGGLVIDFSLMKRLVIDPARRVAWAEPGLTWGAYNAAAHEHRLATPAGDVATVGLGGLTLGGGLGWLTRKHGLTIDNLLAVDGITADGQRLPASAHENADLFWAMRGGGGNAGIAAGFRFRLHPVGQVVGGAIVYPATAETLRAYVDVASAAPHELTTIAFVMHAPPAPFIPNEAQGQVILLITACYAGDLIAGQQVMAPLRTLAGVRPIADTTAPMPYPRLFDLTAEGAASRPHALRAGFMHELSDETIEQILLYSNQATSPFAMTELRVLGGAAAQVPVQETAFAHRDTPLFLGIITAWDDGLEARPQRHIAWTDAYWSAVAPQTDGAYVNFLADDSNEQVRAAYPPATYARLAEIKRRYDPDNLFRGNANVVG